jgi:adenylyltransferase/sulfurtransferase
MTTMLPDLSQEEVFRYARHAVIPGMGLDGQRKLKAASVLIVGAGGLGSSAALYLAAAGVGHIGIVDFDAVDSSNLQRQILHSTAELGQPKVDSGRQRLIGLNPFIQVDAFLDVFTSENAMRIASEYDILIDGSDNLATRYLLNDLAGLTGRSYVYGSVFRFEGQVGVFDASSGPCYRCLFPEPPPPETIQNGSASGVLGVLPGTIGTIQATETIKLITGMGESLKGSLLLYDALDMSFQKIRLHKRPDCKLCGSQASIHSLMDDYDAYCGVPEFVEGALVKYPDLEVDPAGLADLLNKPTPPWLIDLREPGERQVSAIPGAREIAELNLMTELGNVDRKQEMVLFCRRGVRSLRAAGLLRQAGYVNVSHLRGGINAWAQEKDPKMYQY